MNSPETTAFTESSAVPTGDQRKMDALGYEYDNIQDQLNRMTEPQLEGDYAHRLMDRAAFIRGMWRR